MQNEPPTSARIDSTGSHSWLDLASSIINGMVGDYLHNSRNGLAVEMACYDHGRVLELSRLGATYSRHAFSTKVCILMHGLGCHEGIWNYAPGDTGNPTSYGEQLRGDLGYTPFYVRYNTGLSLSANGAKLAELIDQIFAHYPLPIEELMLIGHSMGGLIVRHACQIAGHKGYRWPQTVTRIFYLASPHEGAPLAKFGHAAASTLSTIPNPVTRLLGNIIDLRSQGVKDLRHGVTVPSAGGGATPHQPASLLPHARHYLIAGTVTSDPKDLVSQWFGDGLVTLPRDGGAAGSPAQPAVRVIPSRHHLRLAHDSDVYAQILDWCKEETN